jgi:hypothetical protein
MQRRKGCCGRLSVDAREETSTVPTPRAHDGCALGSILRVLMVVLGTELAGVFQVDVPFLLQQAQFLYEKQLEELQLQMQRVNSSTSLLGQSKGIPRVIDVLF